MLREYIWKNIKKNRYYKITVQHTLLDHIVLICNWGSLVTRRSGGKKYEFQTQCEGVEFLIEAIKKRYKRGYEFISFTK